MVDKQKQEMNSRVKHQKEIAIREIDLMHKEMEAGNYKKAMHHKIIANIAIDEMVSVSEMVDRAKTAAVRD